MRHVIALLVMLGTAAPLIADAQEATPPPVPGCAGKKAGDVCTATDGSESKCVQLDLKLPDGRGGKSARASIAPLVCPRKPVTSVAADVATPKSSSESGSNGLLIAAGCAVAAIAVLLVGAKWMGGAAPSSPEGKKE